MTPLADRRVHTVPVAQCTLKNVFRTVQNSVDFSKISETLSKLTLEVRDIEAERERSLAGCTRGESRRHEQRMSFLENVLVF